MNPAATLTDYFNHRVKHLVKPAYSGAVIAMAGFWRRQMLRNTRFIGITGSAGKTTTKDLLFQLLTSQYPTARSHDSNNQLYDVARTLVTVSPGARFCVQEIGASEPGGFDPMLDLYRPDVGIVTNVGDDHYKSFRGPDAVAAEKGKLIASLPADGVAVLNADDPRVLQMAATTRARVVTFGGRADADLQVLGVESRWPTPLVLMVSWRGEALTVPTQLHGRHLAGSVLAALAAACELGVPLRAAAQTIAHFRAHTARMTVLETQGGITFLRDDFKAPLWSLASTFGFVADARAERRTIVLGTISDYAGQSRPVYRRAAVQALAAADQVIMVGERARRVHESLAATAGDRLLAFASVEEAAAHLKATARRGDLILLKGSFSDHLSRIALTFDRDVNCWLRSCKRTVFCEQCHLVNVAQS